MYKRKSKTETPKIGRKRTWIFYGGSSREKKKFIAYSLSTPKAAKTLILRWQRLLKFWNFSDGPVWRKIISVSIWGQQRTWIYDCLGFCMFKILMFQWKLESSSLAKSGTKNTEKQQRKKQRKAEKRKRRKGKEFLGQLWNVVLEMKREAQTSMGTFFLHFYIFRVLDITLKRKLSITANDERINHKNCRKGRKKVNKKS